MRLFVGGLNYTTTESDLEQHFASQGYDVIEAVVIRNREQEGSPSKGYGFVTLSTSKRIDQVIADFNRSKLMQRTITVGEARPQKAKVQSY